MYRCIECGSSLVSIFISNTHKPQIAKCKSCNKPSDKYYEIAGILKIIDLILLKKQIFRHYLFNRKLTLVMNTTLLVFLILSKVAFRNREKLLCGELLRHDFVNELVFSCFAGLMEVLTFIFLVYLSMHKRASLCKVVNAILISSFYTSFSVVMILWAYTKIEYYLLVETLTLASNVFVIGVVTSVSSENVLLVVFICKYVSVLLSNLVYNKAIESLNLCTIYK